MPDISQITPLDNITYDIKDAYARRVHEPDALQTKTYTNVIATANDQPGGGFFYLKYRGTEYASKWHIKVRVHATVPGYVNYDTETIFDIWGFKNTYSWYACLNRIKSTSYRPIYYNCNFRVSETGYNNSCGGWLGFSLYNATNPTNASYKRTIVVDLLYYEGCTVELQDSLVTPTNIPNRSAHTDWYNSAYNSYDNFDACNYGLKQTGDANTTSIVNLYHYSGNYVADSAVYRYQLLFHTNENTLTPLNNVDNTVGTSKAMLTLVEFDPFDEIFYYSSTTNISAAGSIAASALYYSICFDLRYSLNCGTTLTAHKPLFLVVTPTGERTCKLASSSPWAQTLPIAADGNWYILLGRAYSTYQISLYPKHPIYMHNGTSVVEVLPDNARLANKVDGPSSAVANNVAVFDGTTGKLIKDSGLTMESKEDKMVNAASGSIVHFEDGGNNLCMNPVVAQIEPVQDLHGYDNPWPAGGGKNLLPMTLSDIKTINTSGTWNENKYTLYGVSYTVNTDSGGNVVSITVNGTATAYTLLRIINTNVFDAEIILSGAPSSSSTTSHRLQLESTNGSSIIAQNTGSQPNGTIVSAGSYGRLAIVVPNGATASSAVYYPMIRLSSVSDTTFAPYSNICPITGWTGANVVRIGKNIAKIEFGNVAPSINTGADVPYNAWSSDYIFVDTTKNYVASTDDTTSARYILYYDKNKTYLGYTGAWATSGYSLNSNANWNNTKYIRIRWEAAESTTKHFQLELGSTASNYSLYVCNVYPISWQTEAGTVYGGTLDVATGLLTVNRVVATPTWKGFLAGTNACCDYSTLSLNSTTVSMSTTHNAISNMCIEGNAYWGDARRVNDSLFTESRFAISSNGTQFIVYDPDTTLTQTTFRSKYADLVIVYPLATPVTYQLTPTEIRTLLGINNVWADTGDISVVYPYDTDANDYYGRQIDSVKSVVDGKVNEPTSEGTSGQVLTTDGNGGRTWTTISGGGSVNDVQINSTSIVSNGTANIPYASGSSAGVIKVNDSGTYGIKMQTTGELRLVPATDTNYKSSSGEYKPVMSYNQHKSVFYGLAKAAGDTTQSSSSNEVGVYTDSAKGAIQSMIGINSNLAPVETDLEADQSYAIGDIFSYQGSLYRVTDEIAQSGIITPGTNCEQVTISEYVPDYVATALENHEARQNGIEECVPYLFRKTAGSLGYGTSKEESIVGGSVAFNQPYPLLTSSTLTVANGTNLTFPDNHTASVQASGNNVTFGFYLIAAYRFSVTNHKYLTTVNVTSTAGKKIRIGYDNSGGTADDVTVITLTSNNQTVSTINNAWGDAKSVVVYRHSDDSTSGETFTIHNIMQVDLTQMFGPAVADYLNALEHSTPGAGVAIVKKYIPLDYYEPTTGTLLNVKTSEHRTIGFNQWDEEWELGYWNNGNKTANDSCIRSKNKIRVIPNTTYYVKHNSSFYYTFYDVNGTYLNLSYNSTQGRSLLSSAGTITIPKNAYYMTFNMGSAYGTTYNNDICINISNADYNGTYEPYDMHSYPLADDLELRGVVKLDSDNNLYYDGDTYEHAGRVTRKYGYIDLGTLTYTKYSSSTKIYVTSNNALPLANYSNGANTVCSLYWAHGNTSVYTDTADKYIVIDGNKKVIIKDTAYSSASTFQTAMSGVYLYYELTTSTTELVDEYQTPMAIDSRGTEWFIDERTMPMPVGHTTTYFEKYDRELLDLINSKVSDVQIEGTSVVSAKGIANITTLAPKASPVFTGSISFGRKSGTTVGSNSVAIGNNVTASGGNSFAEGSLTTASGSQSHAEGGNTTASGTGSHSEGGLSTATGNYSHAEGYSNTAGHTAAHAEGSNTTASGAFSHSEGEYTVANHRNQHVFGAYNVADESLNAANVHGDYVEIVGNGDDLTRSNARALDWNGNEYLKGDLYVGCNANSSGGGKVLTESQVNAAIVNEMNSIVDVSDLGWALGTFYDETAEESSSTTRIRSGFVSVTEGTDISLTGNSDCMVVYYYDNAKRYLYGLADVTWAGTANHAVVPSGVHYARILIRASSSNPTISSSGIATQAARCTIKLKLQQDAFIIGDSAVKYDTAQELNATQKDQAQANIGIQNQAIKTILYEGSPTNSTALFTSSNVNIGETIHYDIVLSDNSSLNKNGVIELFDANSKSLGKYGRAYNTNAATHFYSTFTIPIGFASAKWTSNITDPIKVKIYKVSREKLLYEGTATRNQILFDSSDVPGGTDISYEFNIIYRGVDNYLAGFIAIYKSDGTRYGWYGKGSTNSTAYENPYTGTITLPSDFAYAKWDGYAVGDISYIKAVVPDDYVVQEPPIDNPYRRYDLKKYGTLLNGYPHAAFARMCAFDGKLVVVYRCGMRHRIENGVGIIQIDTIGLDGERTHVRTLSASDFDGVTGTDARDYYCMTTNDGENLILFGGFGKGTVSDGYTFDLVLICLDKTFNVVSYKVIADSTDYPYGNILTTPQGKLIFSTFNQSTTDSAIYVSGQALSSNLTNLSNLTFTKTTLFTTTNVGASAFTECCLGYFNDKLLIALRVDANVTYTPFRITSNLEGTSGWGDVIKLQGLLSQSPSLLPHYTGRYLPYMCSKKDTSTGYREPVFAYIDIDNNSIVCMDNIDKTLTPTTGNGYPWFYRLSDETYAVTYYQEALVNSADATVVQSNTGLYYKWINTRVLFPQINNLDIPSSNGVSF